MTSVLPHCSSPDRNSPLAAILPARVTLGPDLPRALGFLPVSQRDYHRAFSLLKNVWFVEHIKRRLLLAQPRVKCVVDDLRKKPTVDVFSPAMGQHPPSAPLPMGSMVVPVGTCSHPTRGGPSHPNQSVPFAVETGQLDLPLRETPKDRKCFCVHQPALWQFHTVTFLMVRTQDLNLSS